jgi:hypothetical protein
MRDILSALDAAERMELIAFFESRMMTEPEQFSEEAQRGFAAYDAFRRELPATLGIA